MTAFRSLQCHSASGGGWSPESSSFPTFVPLSGLGLPFAPCLREGPSLAGDKIQSVTGSSTYFTSCKRVPLLRLQACWLSCSLSTLMGSRKIMNLMPVWAFSLLCLEWVVQFMSHLSSGLCVTLAAEHSISPNFPSSLAAGYQSVCTADEGTLRVSVVPCPAIIHLKVSLLKCVWVLSCVWLSAIPWTVARQAALSMGFARPEW